MSATCRLKAVLQVKEAFPVAVFMEMKGNLRACERCTLVSAAGAESGERLIQGTALFWQWNPAERKRGLRSAKQGAEIIIAARGLTGAAGV